MILKIFSNDRNFFPFTYDLKYPIKVDNNNLFDNKWDDLLRINCGLNTFNIDVYLEPILPVLPITEAIISTRNL